MLAQDGFDLVIADIAPDDDGVAESLRRHGGAVTYLSGDISDLNVHTAWIDAIRLGRARIDCLGNNAGMDTVERGDVLALRPENFDRVMAVNLRGTSSSPRRYCS